MDETEKLLLNQFLDVAKNEHDRKILYSAILKMQEGELAEEERHRLEQLHEETLRESEGRRWGGKADKRPKAILEAIRKILKENPSLTTKEVWLKIPSIGSPLSVAGYEVYREEGEVCQEEIRTGKTRSITWHRFERYVSAERKLLFPPKTQS